MLIFPLDASPVWIITRQFCSTHQSTNTKATIDDNNYEDSIKVKILDASLAYVKDVGWSKDALAEGAKSIGYPGITHGMFSRGGAELIHHFQTTSNEKLVQYLKDVRMQN